MTPGGATVGGTIFLVCGGGGGIEMRFFWSDVGLEVGGGGIGIFVGGLKLGGILKSAGGFQSGGGILNPGGIGPVIGGNPSGGILKLGGNVIPGGGGGKLVPVGAIFMLGGGRVIP